MKAQFKLGASVFDIELSTVELSITEAEAGMRRLFIEAEAIAEQVAEDEEWNWSGFPPKFYLRGLTVPDYSVGSKNQLQVPMKHEEYEMALYLGEHNDVTDVVVVLTAWSSVEITGTVDAMGTIAPFQIEFAVEDAQQ